MKRFKVLIILFLLNISLFAYNRIITLAPALTEIVFKIGEGNRIVGIDSYSFFPSEAKKIVKVGSFMTINRELILSLKPDLIIAYRENIGIINFAKTNGIKAITVKHKTLKDIYKSIKQIGNILNKKRKSNEIIKNIKERLDSIKKRVKRRKKILVIISRQPGTFKNMYILGKGDFLNEIIELSGGDNIFKGSIMYPQVSEEIFYTNSPDIIVELYPNKKISKKILISDWEKFKDKKFYKNIHIITVDYPVIPGPRIYKTAELFYKIIND